MQPDLRYTLSFAGNRYHLLALCYGQAQGLLHVNIFARPASGHELECMPMVRRCDDDGIQSLLVDQLAVIAMERRLAANLLLSGLQVGLIDIAQSRDLGIFVNQEGIEELVTPITHADKAEADALVGSQYRGRGDMESGQGTECRRSPRKCAPIDLARHGLIPRQMET